MNINLAALRELRCTCGEAPVGIFHTPMNGTPLAALCETHWTAAQSELTPVTCLVDLRLRGKHDRHHR